MSIGLIQNDVNKDMQREASAQRLRQRIACLIAKCSLSSLFLLIADINGDPHLSGLCQNKCPARSSMNYGLDIRAFLGRKIHTTHSAKRCGNTTSSTDF